MVEQRAVCFDQMRLKQQSAYFASGFQRFNSARQRQHARFVRLAQVRQHASAYVYAFAYVKRQAAVAMKNIHTRRVRQATDAF